MTSHINLARRSCLLPGFLVFLISLQILIPMLCLQRAQAQEPKNLEILALKQRFGEIHSELRSIDIQLNTLKQKFDVVTNEKNKLSKELREEEAKPKSLWGRVTGIFSRKKGKIPKLMAEAKELNGEIDSLKRKRAVLLENFTGLADELIDKSSLLMTGLMDVVRESNLGGDFDTRNDAWEQVSLLWELAESTRTIRREYIPDTINTQPAKTFPELLSDDSEELRLGAAILRDWAQEARSKAAEHGKKIEELQSQQELIKGMADVLKDMQRSDEERGATGVGITRTPLGSDVDGTREINKIQIQIEQLLELKQRLEEEAQRFENQSGTLERRASQIDDRLKGKSEDD